MLIITERACHGFEIKRTSAPKMTPSMRHAMTDLRLDQLTVIHAGEHSFPLAEQIRALSINQLTDLAAD
jgi:hypothetical protein